MRARSTTSQSPVVTTSAGALRGRRQGAVTRFSGIPYAAAPRGRLRFAPPQPPPPWEGVRPATSFGPVSLQGATPLLDWLGVKDPPQSENCCSLNVWTPAADAARRPVMVWIHGGGFVSGSGRLPIEDPTKLAARGDLVVVSCNYRLGALGFLSLGQWDDALASSGLSGILDQVAVLRWVRDNIESFGGDPANVTIFGSSAGAMSVGTLLTLPAARGLFRRAIAQSGAASTAMAAPAAARRTRRFMDLAGCSDAAALGALEPGDLLRAQEALRSHLQARYPADRAGTGALTPFQPVIDGHHLEASPLALAQQRQLAPVELLTGTAEDEWSFFSAGGPGPSSDDELASDLAPVLQDPGGAVAAYRRHLGAGATTKALHDAMMTDRVFRAPMHALAQASVRAGNPTFLYRFAYPTPAMGGALGACHSLEVPFVFDNREGPVTAFVGQHSPASLAQAMQQAWISFARHGDPQHPGLPAWRPAGEHHQPILRFDRILTVMDDPLPELLGLWEDRR